MAVECAAVTVARPPPAWPLTVNRTADDANWEIDWRPMIDALARAPGHGDRAALAARFHASLSAAITAVAQACGIGDVVLTGGCFQNVLLLELTSDALSSAGFSVLRHRELPPNDGGISAGQALGARWGLTEVATAAASV
jgi:hydrogenase maturation protein HypF